MNNKRVITIVLCLLSVLCLGAGTVLFFRENAASASRQIMDLSAPEEQKKAAVMTDSQEHAASDSSAATKSESIEDVKNPEKGSETENNASSDSGTKEEKTNPEINAQESKESLTEQKENPYKEYFLRNADMIAWLKIPDTIVDYPVMWTPEDEDYYLHRGFQKEDYLYGCLILDTDSSMNPLTTNLIIHGHNDPGVMFGELDRYMDKEYRDRHPYIYLYGKDYEHIYEVMAVFQSKVFYTTDVCFKYYKFFQADTEAEFLDYYDSVKAMSMYDTEVKASFGDRFLTLSTCSYHTENGRFVVVAKEIEPGDTYKPFDE